MPFKFQVQMKIRKPRAEVFAAVVEPRSLEGYFVARATAPLASGSVVQWKWPELEELTDVKVVEVTPPKRIILRWEAAEGGYDTEIVMTFTDLPGDETMVQIAESGWRDTPEGQEASYGNAGGWAIFLSSLKAYLEYGVNLRQGGYF